MNSIKNSLPSSILDKGPASSEKTQNQKRDSSKDPKMLEAAKSFENQFIRQMIAEMRKTVPKDDDIVGTSMADDIFRDQLDDQYADMWTDQGGVGIADMIYDQLHDKFGKQTNPILPKNSGEVLPLSQTQTQNAVRASSPKASHDLFNRSDKDLFLIRPAQNGFDIKSREPLPERVELKAPMSGVVLQTGALQDGRQMVVIKHDEGLVSQFVHTGYNRVKMNTRVEAGDTIAEFPASQKGEVAKVNFRVAPGT